jgi:HPt (histidine-containing phosphotransfer) domain-containing protein
MPEHTAPVDETVLATMAESVGFEVTALVIQAYLGSAENRTNALRSALDAGALDLRRAAHALTAGSATVGARHLADLCWEVESRVEGDDLDAARRAARQALTQMPRVVSWLRASRWATHVA